ncbi:hypothetical protein KSS87_007570 [Heliosperma pusillum]|nr:hypothetical protein KSS87_007570 [Heliosperma pusillum]
MAGMLPGVESARRRRVHQTSTPAIGGVVSFSPSSRRSSFPTSSAFSVTQERSRGQHEADEELGQVAREAKERLDERLRSQRNSSLVTRNNEEVSEEKKGVKKGKGWGNKLGWKSGEQEKCTICVDEFKVGDDLGCAH